MPDKPDKFAWDKRETKIISIPKKLTPEEYDKIEKKKEQPKKQ